MKRFYARTNKNRAVRQMTRLERREAFLRSYRRKTAAKGHLGFDESEVLPYTPPDVHHHISKSHNFHFNLTSFLSENKNDPAVEVIAVPILIKR